MAGFLKKAQVYLGLGPDDEYEDYDEPVERSSGSTRDGREARDPRDLPPGRPTTSSVRPTTMAPSGRAPSAAAYRAGREAARPRVAPEVDAGAEGSVVRTLPPKERTPDGSGPPAKPKPPARPPVTTTRPVVVSPTTFHNAQEVADKFKANQPVIVNLQGADRDLARRLLDFCSGICYALGGHMERVATRVYLLTPADVELSPEDRRRLAERGLAG